VEPTLHSFCSTSFFAPSNCSSCASRARTRPSAPPKRALSSCICWVASARQTSKLCFWSSSFLSLLRVSSSLTSSSCSLALQRSSSASACERIRLNSCLDRSRLPSSSTICFLSWCSSCCALSLSSISVVSRVSNSFSSVCIWEVVAWDLCNSSCVLCNWWDICSCCRSKSRTCAWRRVRSISRPVLVSSSVEIFW